MIVDSAIYVDGRRSASHPLEEIHEASREQGGFAWIGLRDATDAELEAVAGEFELPELAVRDAIKAHQRPKVERYGNSLFVVLKAAHYVDEKEEVEFGEIHIFVGDGFVITVRHGQASELVEARQRMESEPDLLRRGPLAVLCAILTGVVDDYGPVVDGLENDIDQIEVEVFGGEPSVTRRIYKLSREVIQFHQATEPLAGALESLTEDGVPDDVDPRLRRYLRDVRDRALHVTERVEGFRELLSNILSVNLTLVSLDQNDQVKKISAWAAILVVPTLITGIYGMNFQYMPELNWMLGYPFSLLLMLTISLILYRTFKRRRWL